MTEADTARALGSGDVDVLGTPRALALAEAATVRAAAAALTPGQTTVGTHVELDHLAPSPVGAAGTVGAVPIRAPAVGRVVAGGSTHRTACARRRMNAQHTVAASSRSPPSRRARREVVRTINLSLRPRAARTPN